MLSLLVSLSIAIATTTGGGLPMKTPKAVGMSSERLAKIDHVVERGISAGGYPGAAVVVGRRGAAVCPDVAARPGVGVGRGVCAAELRAGGGLSVRLES